MQNDLIPLHRLPLRSIAHVKRLEAEGTIRRRMLDLGLIINTPVEAIHKSPSGDPTAYQIRGAVIALRFEEASQIFVEIGRV
jgi:ferrous iron transport protein A